MLARHIIGYLPSLVIPAITSFAAVYGYTRLLSPDEYGHYALAINAMMLVCVVFFYWLQTALPRLMPQAIKQGQAEELRVTAYAAFAAIGSALALCALVVSHYASIPLVWLIVPLALARALLNINEAFHRSALDFKRYNLIECGQAILALAAGLLGVYYFHLGARGALMGLLLGMLCMALVDLKRLLRSSLAHFRLKALKSMVHFGLPLVFTYGLAFIVSSSDRFFIEYYQGATQVGMYAAGYVLIDRIMALVFLAVATPSFSLTIHTLEHRGMEAAKAQTYANGSAMLAIAIPACTGLMLASHPLGAVMIGSAFRASALRVMPWITLAAFLNGLSTHYFDHAFHLAKKPYLLLFTQGPAAALNLLLNILWIPAYGFMGAAYATLASYALLLALSVAVGQRAFPVQFPFKPALQIMAAAALMALALSMITFPNALSGLIAMVITGSAVYAAGLIAFNVMGLRLKAGALLRALSLGARGRT